MQHVPEQAPFGDKFIYNNYMYMVLGHVAEKLGGDTWEHLITSRLLKPLGMESTKILSQPDDLIDSKVAKPYIYKKGELVNGTDKFYR